jgi:protease PrsW
MGSPLRRETVSRRIVIALMCVLAFAAFVQLGLFAGMGREHLVVFIEALVCSTALSVVPIAVLRFLDRRERESAWLLAAAFLWGGLIATGLALPFNMAFFRLVDIWLAYHPLLGEMLGPEAPSLIAAPLSAPIVEEIAKAAGVILLFSLLRAEFDNARDGLVYGALIGAGFNWFEASLYVMQDYASHGEGSFGAQLGGRYALFGLGGHVLFTALFGAFLGFAMQTRRRWLKVISPVIGLALAIAAHMLNNALPLFAALAGARGEEAGPSPELGFSEAFLVGSLTQLVIFLPFLILLLVVLWRSGDWERRVIREELASEVGRTISREEYHAILRDRMLRTRLIDRMHPKESAALVNAQHELAFRKRRVRNEGGDPENDPLVGAWRDDIRHLRHAIPVK